MAAAGRAFVSWLDVVAEQKAHRNAAQKVVARIRNGAIAAAFARQLAVSSYSSILVTFEQLIFSLQNLYLFESTYNSRSRVSSRCLHTELIL